MNKKIIFISIGAAIIFAFTIIGCDLFATVNSKLFFEADIQVRNNSGRAVTIGAGEKVEFYIHMMEYEGRVRTTLDNGREVTNVIHIVRARGWSTNERGTKWIEGNEGWYVISDPFPLSERPINDEYKKFKIWATRLRIGGVEYPLGNNYFRTFDAGSPQFEKSIVIDRYSKNVRTIFTIDPDILECWEENVNGEKVLRNGFDPFNYISVEGIVNAF